MFVRLSFAIFLMAGTISYATADDTGASTGMRKWSDASGKFSVQAEFVTFQEGMVQLKKADGSTISVALERLCSEDQKVAQALASKAAPEGTVELKYDDGKPAGKQSFAGGGQTVQFEAPAGKWNLTSVKLHGSRYGLPVPPKEDILIWVCDDQGKQLAELKVPYKLFRRGEEKWVTMKVPPTPVPPKFRLCFYFNAEATKGIYVSYDGKGTGQSLFGVPDDGFQPWTKGNWMIRALIEPAKAGSQAEQSPFEPQR